MDTTVYITLKEFCSTYDVEEQFVMQLNEIDLIDARYEEESYYIAYQELPKLEKIVRLQREFNFTPEGLDVIHNLLDKIQNLQEEVTLLKRRLGRFE
ncbi:hypothetical protein GCM10009117_22730 [Gangjinia marincola]|uniref:MerR HTH family regulatory protein n=1 Tax=Gangjinia marincola TaxID=578463 RepID=A0ABP3XYP9_9FLAO